MESGEFEARMGELEIFHTLRLLPGAWTALRVDGQGISRFTETVTIDPFSFLGLFWRFLAKMRWLQARCLNSY